MLRAGGVHLAAPNMLGARISPRGETELPSPVPHDTHPYVSIALKQPNPVTRMGKVWLEDLVPEDFMSRALDPAKTLTNEDVKAARQATRVPAVIYDAPLSEVAQEYWTSSRQA
jgi:hypothetical protein